MPNHVTNGTTSGHEHSLIVGVRNHGTETHNYKEHEYPFTHTNAPSGVPHQQVECKLRFVQVALMFP